MRIHGLFEIKVRDDIAREEDEVGLDHLVGRAGGEREGGGRVSSSSPVVMDDGDSGQTFCESSTRSASPTESAEVEMMVVMCRDECGRDLGRRGKGREERSARLLPSHFLISRSQPSSPLKGRNGMG